jgi:hypothetical protein
VSSYYLDLNDARVAKLDLTIPYYGAWVADVEVPLPAASFTGQQTLTIGNLVLLGASLRGGSFAGESKMRLVGGFGGWPKTIAAAGYQNPGGVMASLVLGDAATNIGEQLSIVSDLNLGNFWCVENRAAANLLRLLCRLWWIDPATGATKACCEPSNATRPSTAIQSDFEALDWNPGKGVFKITTEDPASWMPGNTFTNTFLGTTATISSTRFVCDDKGDMHLSVLSSDAPS